MNTLRIREVDLLVVPEFYASGLVAIPNRARVVVFNQGPHHTFDLIPLRAGSPGWPYSQIARLEGILTVSQDGAELLRLAFPEVLVGIARNVVDRRIFHPSADGGGKRISFVPSRRTDELLELMHFLNARTEIQTGEWEMVPLNGLSERGMADALRDSSIFLSLSDRDGFGLPPAEAMACAAYVVGYHGGGGREFFDPAYCSPVASTTELLAALEEAMNLPELWRRERGEKASARILGHYTVEGLTADLECFYRGLL
jgi:glycosyltransferase involved in cell wall biosynthesis